MKPWQWIVMFAWVGLPLLALISLFVLSPGHMQYMFIPMGSLDGLTLFLGFTGLNFILLLFGFIITNQNKSDVKPKNEEKDKTFSFLVALFLTFTFIFLTLPSLWVAFFYPSLVRLASNS